MFDMMSPDFQLNFRYGLWGKIFKGKPLIEKLHLAAWTPPATNAELVNPWNGLLSPISSPTALILFSSDADNAAILPLVKALDPNVRTFDGSGIVCPEIAYGSDGRKILGIDGIINGLAYQATIGILCASRHWGSAWNDERQAPYTKLFADKIDDSDAQLNWGH